MTKSYPWPDVQMTTLDLERIIGKRLTANRLYTLDARDLPFAFQERLSTDGFDLARSVTIAVALVGGGFGIRVEQE